MARDSLSTLEGRHFDVFVVGGGINGLSAAQHLAAAGFTVLLCERNDFVSAASSRSTRLLHNGLRYLAPKNSLWEFLRRPDLLRGKIRSARESLAAMGQIVSTAPERVRPIDLVMPVFKDAPYRGWQVDWGVRFLRRFDSHGVALDYRRFRPGDPAGNPIFTWFRDQDRIADFLVFRDYQFCWPEGLAMDAGMDAARMGAVIRNYTAMGDYARAPGGGWRIALHDRLTPGSAATVTASQLVNTAGVWIDEVNGRAAGVPKAARKIAAVKGIHIAVQLPPDFRGAAAVAMNREDEAIFAIPWGDLHYIGPTETLYGGDLADPRPEETEIAFLLDEANHLFPKLGLLRRDVQFAWAGVRPITYDAALPKGRRLPFSVLHDQSNEGNPDMWSLTWGTVNLHRVSGQNIAAAVGRRMAPSGTSQAIDYGARKFPEMQNSPGVVPGDPSVTLADLQYCAAHEQVETLVDLLFRRTQVGWRVGMTRQDVERAARAVAGTLGWDADREAAEVRRYCEHVRVHHLQTIA